MAAFTRLADGSLRRWHAGDLSECDRDDCTEAHATKAELGDFTGAER